MHCICVAGDLHNPGSVLKIPESSLTTSVKRHKSLAIATDIRPYHRMLVSFESVQETA